MSKVIPAHASRAKFEVYFQAHSLMIRAEAGPPEELEALLELAEAIRLALRTLDRRAKVVDIRPYLEPAHAHGHEHRGDLADHTGRRG